MDEEQKKQIAVFRFGVIAEFVTGATLTRGEKERLLKDKCARKWNIPYSNRTSIGRSTIRDWIANYQNGGNRLEALYPSGRTDKGKSRTIDEHTANNLICLRDQMPKVPSPDKNGPVIAILWTHVKVAGFMDQVRRAAVSKRSPGINGIEPAQPKLKKRPRLTLAV